MASSKWKAFAGTPRPIVIVWALIAGGVLILLVERLRPRPTAEASGRSPGGRRSGSDAQILSLVPGMSRSASTIMGGVAVGVARPAATEFSLLLAIRVMFAAAGLDLVSYRSMRSSHDVPMFAIGLVTAFASAVVAIRWLVRVVSTTPSAASLGTGLSSASPCSWQRGRG